MAAPCWRYSRRTDGAGGLAPTQDEEVVQAKLKFFAILEPEVAWRESLDRQARIETVVLVKSHPGHQPEPRQGTHDAIDNRLWDREHHATAVAEEIRACGRHAPLLAVVEVLENGQHGDHVELLLRTKVVREPASDQADRPVPAVAR